MEELSEVNNEGFTKDQKERVVESIAPINKSTEEEFQNFMHRVTEVEKIVKKLASSNKKEQEYGELLADEILKENKKEITENEIKVKVERTVINKYKSKEEYDPNKMSQEAFMRSIEKDANERAEDRKIRNERAETYKRIGNGAFRKEDFEKAITYYTKAIEQRKDSSVLWNNRALAYMQLGLYEKALSDCEWALKANRANLKALLNSAKCYNLLQNYAKCKECIDMAKETNPHMIKFINEFVEGLNNQQEVPRNQVLD
ncbi:tetratricopeptide repeat protein 12-like [Orussus abietinus]|uniref:tetratricopeptide repeat protein 12-like n=1 Tax=Orussus abietinus TaxID=222816 RepID=UPI00062695C1|nr:tetratricopeptide repeat protein 12-like [Orussus abietinus]